MHQHRRDQNTQGLKGPEDPLPLSGELHGERLWKRALTCYALRIGVKCYHFMMCMDDRFTAYESITITRIAFPFSRSTLAFQIMKDRSLGFDPVRIVYARTHKDCEYIIVSGSNKALAIYTQEGVKVTSIAEQESWVWACAVRPESQCIVRTMKIYI